MLSKLIGALAGTLSVAGVFANPVMAATLGLNFTKLDGLTGGNPAMTAVYRGELSNLALDLNSISITDNSSALGGAAGQFTGFDLDGISLSRQRIDHAAHIASLATLNVFDFASGTLVAPGTQRGSADGALFGTAGTGIDVAAASLGRFDANPIVGPTVGGFVSLGDGGQIGFNLTTPLTPTDSLYLYIGEVGDNGEVASGRITVSDQLIELPPSEPSPPPAPEPPAPEPPAPEPTPVPEPPPAPDPPPADDATSPPTVPEPEAERIPEPSFVLAVLLFGGVAAYARRQPNV